MTLTEIQDERGTIIVLTGEADLTGVPLFQGKMRELAAAKVPRAVIDFSAVTFVNTPIWAVLVEYYQASTNAGTQFALAGLRGRVAASFEVVRLGHFLPALGTIDEAFAAIASRT